MARSCSARWSVHLLLPEGLERGLLRRQVHRNRAVPIRLYPQHTNETDSECSANAAQISARSRRGKFARVSGRTTGRLRPGAEIAIVLALRRRRRREQTVRIVAKIYNDTSSLSENFSRICLCKATVKSAGDRGCDAPIIGRCQNCDTTTTPTSATTPQNNNKPRSRLYIYRAGGKKAEEVRTVESTTCLLGELDAKNASSFAFIDSVGEAFCNHTVPRSVS